MKSIALLGVVTLLCACSSLQYEKDGVNAREATADYRICEAKESIGGALFPFAGAFAGGMLGILTCVLVPIDPLVIAGCGAGGAAIGFLAAAGQSVSKHDEGVNQCMTLKGYRVSTN